MEFHFKIPFSFALPSRNDTWTAFLTVFGIVSIIIIFACVFFSSNCSLASLQCDRSGKANFILKQITNSNSNRNKDHFWALWIRNYYSEWGKDLRNCFTIQMTGSHNKTNVHFINFHSLRAGKRRRCEMREQEREREIGNELIELRIIFGLCSIRICDNFSTSQQQAIDHSNPNCLFHMRIQYAQKQSFGVHI